MRTVMMTTLQNMIYGATMMTFPNLIRNRNRRMTKRTIDHRRQRAVHHPAAVVPVAVDHVQSPDRSHIHALVQSQIQILNINPVRLVAIIANRNRPAMVVEVVDAQLHAQVPIQEIVDRIGRPEQDREVDRLREVVVGIMMDVVVNIL